MIRKLSIALLCLLLVVGFVSQADASTKAKTATTGKGVAYCNGLVDLSSGNTAEIDVQGRLHVKRRDDYTCSDIQDDDAQIMSGAGVLHSVTINTATAEDYLLIYDNTSATGTPKADIICDVANEQYTVALDINIATGIYCAYSGGGGAVTYSVQYAADDF